MSILTATGVAQSFGEIDIFSGISVTVPNDGKIGLVGPNGIGKTTLLLILAGEVSPASGALNIARNTRIGYLPQQAAQAFTGRSHSVYQEMQTVFQALDAQEARLREMESAMADNTASEETYALYSKAQAAFEFAGGYDRDIRIKQVLTGLGFPPDKWDLPLEHLSGGQKTRALLARLLLERPDLLILDEPTNHLDVEAIEWLEGTLSTWDGAMLLVSHDRYFLDRVVNVIWEMSRTGMETYRGGYSAYVQQREERWTRREKEYRAMRERLDKEMDYIRRNIAGQRTQMAKGKLSRLSREVEALHAGGLDALQGQTWLQATTTLDLQRAHVDVAYVAQRIKELPAPSHRPPQINLRLQPSFRSGNIVLRTSGISVGYPGTSLFKSDSIELRRLECAALIGPNGTGKSTFLRTLRSELDPLEGELQLGASLKLGYFAQAHDGLNLDNTVLDEFLNHHPMQISEARNHLAQYLFRGDDVYQIIHTLSGGERGRLALSMIALENANFLLLDEPTNHLDIPAQETLQAVLEKFDGTILLVTHDRYLVDKLATQIWDLRDGCLNVFEGSYQEFLAKRTAERQLLVAERAEQKAAAKSVESSNQGLSKNEARRRDEAIDAIMVTIDRTETEIATLMEELQQVSAAQDFDKIQRVSLEYEAAQQRLETLLLEWETLASE